MTNNDKDMMGNPIHTDGLGNRYTQPYGGDRQYVDTGNNPRPNPYWGSNDDKK